MVHLIGNGIVGPIHNRTAEIEVLKERQALAGLDVTPSNATNTTTESLLAGTSLQTEAAENGDISSGGVAGIVIGVVLALIVLSVIIFILYRRRLLPWMSKKPDTVIFSFDTSFQNLIDCSSANNSLRGTERRSNVSRRSSNRESTSYASSAPNLTRDVPTRSSYSSAPSRRSTSRSSTDPRYTDPRYSTPTYQPNPYSPDTDTSDLYQQPVPSYRSPPSYSQNPYYFPQGRVHYKQYNPNYVPSNVFSAPRGGYTASHFQYRPSRHIDRQLQVYYNWAINEEMAEPVRPRPRVHQPRIIAEERRY